MSPIIQGSVAGSLILIAASLLTIHYDLQRISIAVEQHQVQR